MTTKMAPASRVPEGPHTQERAATLHQFLTLTAASPAPALRRAIAAALLVETPSSREAYGRLYCRVMTELGVAPGTDCDPASTPAVPAAA